MPRLIMLVDVVILAFILWVISNFIKEIVKNVKKSKQ